MISVSLLSCLFPSSEFVKQVHSLKQYLAIDEKVLGKQVKVTGLAIQQTSWAQMEEYYRPSATLPDNQAQPLILGVIVVLLSTSQWFLFHLF